MLHLEAKVHRMQGALDERVLFSEKFMTMFEIKKEDLFANSCGVLRGDVGGGGGDSSNGVDGDGGGDAGCELNGESGGGDSGLNDGEGVEVRGKVERGDAVAMREDSGLFSLDELSCRDLIETKVLKYVSQLRDENISLMDRVRSFDRVIREAESSQSSLNLQTRDLSTQKMHLESKCKRLCEENASLQGQLAELKEVRDKASEEMRKLKGEVKKGQTKMTEVEAEKECLEEDVERLKAVAKEKNKRLEELSIHVTELKTDLESACMVMMVMMMMMMMMVMMMMLITMMMKLMLMIPKKMMIHYFTFTPLLL